MQRYLILYQIVEAISSIIVIAISEVTFNQGLFLSAATAAGEHKFSVSAFIELYVRTQYPLESSGLKYSDFEPLVGHHEVSSQSYKKCMHNF